VSRAASASFAATAAPATRHGGGPTRDGGDGGGGFLASPWGLGDSQKLLRYPGSWYGTRQMTSGGFLPMGGLTLTHTELSIEIRP